jgi:hypothetical protein
MKLYIYQSTSYKYFEREDSINKDTDKYFYASIQYLRNFNRQLDLLQISKEFLPTFIMTKGKVRGLMEFFLSGFPNKEYAWALFNQGIPETKRTDATLSWDVISRDYLKVIEDTLDHMEKVEDVAHR